MQWLAVFGYSGPSVPGHSVRVYSVPTVWHASWGWNMQWWVRPETLPALWGQPEHEEAVPHLLPILLCLLVTTWLLLPYVTYTRRIVLELWVRRWKSARGPSPSKEIPLCVPEKRHHGSTRETNSWGKGVQKQIHGGQGSKYNLTKQFRQEQGIRHAEGSSERGLCKIWGFHWHGGGNCTWRKWGAEVEIGVRVSFSALVD